MQPSLINVLEPRSTLLKQFVDSIYVLKKGIGRLEFTAYPSTNTPIALLRNTTVRVENEDVYIENSDTTNHFSIVCNKFAGSIHLQYPELVDEIAINFKPLGFSSFTQLKPKEEQVFFFHEWNKLLPALFDQVLATEDQQQQLYYIEAFLLQQYIPLPGESVMLKALELLNTSDYKMQEIATLCGVHYKQLYRYFTENIGCSPAYYRKLVKFRTSIISKIKKGNKARLVDICYAHDYTDQPYFIKQFKAFTGERPSRFFKNVTSFGNDKVIFKID